MIDRDIRGGQHERYTIIVMAFVIFERFLVNVPDAGTVCSDLSAQPRFVLLGRYRNVRDDIVQMYARSFDEPMQGADEAFNRTLVRREDVAACIESVAECCEAIARYNLLLSALHEGQELPLALEKSACERLP